MKLLVRCLLILVAALATLPMLAETQTLSITAAEAIRHVGEAQTVCGTVVSAKFAEASRGQPTFLNLDKPYPNHVFTIVIWGDKRPAFGEPEVTYLDKAICISGRIETYRGRAQIVATRPSQIVPFE